jgi:ribosome biogenesis GTPase
MDIAVFFPEIAPVLGQCKFGLSCQHDEEPGCAVCQGVMDGRISPYRYQSYLRLKDDL